MEEEGKKTKVKQKIEIEKIDKANDLSSTFAKRKYGIHKKACELSTLCGDGVDIFMFSPCGRSFCYGDPSLRLLTRTIVDAEHPLEGVNCNQLVEDHKRSEIDELNKKHNALQDQFHGEKAREKKLKDILKQRKNDGWWEVKVQALSCEHNEKIEASLLELHEKLSNELSIKCGGNASHGEDSFVVVSPPNQGDDPFLHNTSNENTFSPSNQH
ncbi:hypothetical protein SESBI_32598 [Sesbania bispinosa]|nr:hypothetical protein SESBI_32598 [Sesbania bispinosa]